MSIDRIEELLWRRVDGLLDGDESEELEDYLAGHPEARKLEDEVSRLALSLSEVEPLRPPGVLRERIDQALARAPVAGAPPTPFRTRSARTERGWWHTRLLPLAAGLVIGAAVTTLMLPGARDEVDTSSAAGTMIMSTSDGAVVPVEIDLGSGVGKVTGSLEGRTAVFEIDIVADEEVELRIEAPTRPPRLVGAEHSGGAASHVAVVGSSIVVHAGGPGHHRVTTVMPGAEHELRLLVSTEGGVLAEKVLRREGAERRQ
jgi:anti-sigma factor RsiW